MKTEPGGISGIEDSEDKKDHSGEKIVSPVQRTLGQKPEAERMGKDLHGAGNKAECSGGYRQVFLTAIEEQFFSRHSAKLFHGEAVALAGDQKDRGDEHAEKGRDPAE